MKKFFLLMILTVSTVFMTQAQLVRFEKVWIEHNVYYNNQKGMNIHASFTVDNFQGQTCHLNLMHYIEHSDGRELWGNQNGYYTIDRHGNPQATVKVGFDITPEWQYTTYNDWWIFMPYSAFCISNGHYDLRVVSLAHNTTHDRWCAKAAQYTPFTYDVSAPKPQAPANKTFTPGASGLMIDNTYMNDLNGNRVFVPDGNVNSNTPSSNYNRHEAQCAGCHGSGRCQHCGGTGWVNNNRSKCSLCHGTGRCQSCAGTGKIHGNF